MPQDVIVALVSVVFASITGGITNAVAIWMLFHPYEPRRFGRWRLHFPQGAVPKNQARLAAAIGRTVGTRLLTHEDLVRSLSEPGFRSAFDEQLAAFLDTVLHRERGSLRDILPDAVRLEAEDFLYELAARAIKAFEAYVASEAFEAAVDARVDELLVSVENELVGSLLTPERAATVTEVVDGWLQRAVESDDFGRTVEEYVDRAARRLLAPDRTFEEILPLGLVGAVERATQAYLPLVIERLGSLLKDPDTRERFESTLHELLHQFLRDLRFHQRVVARLVVTEETVDRVLDIIEKEGAERLSELLQDPAVQAAMAKTVNEAFFDLLRRPVQSVVGGPDDPKVREALRRLADWVVRMARDPAARVLVVEKLDYALKQANAYTWGDLFARVPADQRTRGLTAIARSNPASRLYREVGDRLVGTLLDQPIGVPARWFAKDTSRRIEQRLSDPLWAWLQTQVPTVVQRLDVAGRVETKVLEYPTHQLEKLIRRVTERELRLIVRLGYVLGAVIGIMMVFIGRVTTAFTAG